MKTTPYASVARIKDNTYDEIVCLKFWAEIHGKTLTTSSRTYEVVSVTQMPDEDEEFRKYNRRALR